MTFAIEKNNPVSKKIILFEIDLPYKTSEGGSILLNYDAGIWFTTLAPGPVTVSDAYGSTGYYKTDLVDDGLDVGGVRVNQEYYVKVASLAELYLVDKAFYYNLATTKLYIHYENWHKPVGNLRSANTVIDAITGFCDYVDQETGYGCYYNNVYYEPRIESVPAISKKKDPLFFGLIAFNGGSVTLQNKDGFLDNYRNYNIYFQSCRLKIGFEGMLIAEFRTVFSGVVDGYSYNWDKFTVKINDYRKKLSFPIPTNYLTKAVYPYISDSNNNAPKPIAYGLINNAPLICLNEEQYETPVRTTSYTFFIADTEFYNITSVSAVYVKTGDSKTLIAPANYSWVAATGILTMQWQYCGKIVSDWDGGGLSETFEGSVTEITATFTACAVTNAGSVIKDLLLRYGGFEFLPVFFNQPEFNFSESRAANVSLYIGKATTLIKAIEECCVASELAFIVQDDGKFTLRYYIADRTPIRTIYADEWMGSPETGADESQFLSSVVIGYNPDVKANSYSTTRNTTYEAAVFAIYKSYNEKPINTILTSEASAIAKSEKIMLLSKYVSEVVKRTTKIQNCDLEIMDFIIGDPFKRKGQVEKLAIYEIISKNINLSKAENTFDFKFNAWYTPPAPVVYNPGVLWSHKLWGNKMYSVAYGA
jgi:hypothetical protein